MAWVPTEDGAALQGLGHAVADRPPPLPRRERAFAPSWISELNAIYSRASAEDIAHVALRDLFPGRMAVVSSFGASSIGLLHLISRIDSRTPVIFLETGQHFPETLAYRDRVVERLGLSDVRSIKPDPERLARVDPRNDLHGSDPDLCCWTRKVEPLAEALGPFDAWATGRKRYQGGRRSNLKPFELDDGRVKVNPLAGWSTGTLSRYLERHDLPQHPLVVWGYRSIGCAPCTSPVTEGEDERAGRWRGRLKTECGIHAGFTDGEGI